MNLANGEISVEEIERLYAVIKGHLLKERNSICLGLQVLITNIRDWYTDNMNIAERLLNREPITYGYFFKYTYRDERASVARESITFIEEVVIPYENEKSPGTNQRSRKLGEQLKKVVFGSTDPF